MHTLNYGYDESKCQHAPDALRHRIFNVVPATQYGFDTLLRLVDIDVTRAVPTAAIRCSAAPVLMINPDFVAAWCVSDEDLFSLIMHELHHVLMGHTRLFPRPTRAQRGVRRGH